MRQPRLGVLSSGLIGGLGLAGLAVLMVLTHGAFWLNVVAGNANPFDMGQLAGVPGQLFGAALRAAGAGRRRMRVDAAATAAGRPGRCTPSAAGVATLGVAKWGAGESYFLGAIAAVSVLSAVWVARFLDSAPPAPPALGSRRSAVHPGGAAVARRAERRPALAARSRATGPFLGRAPTFDDQQAGQLISAEIRRRAWAGSVRGPELRGRRRPTAGRQRHPAAQSVSGGPVGPDADGRTTCAPTGTLS